MKDINSLRCQNNGKGLRQATSNPMIKFFKKKYLSALIQKCASNSIIRSLLLLSYINHPKDRIRAISDVVYDFQVASFLCRSSQEGSSSFMAMKGYESLFFFSTTGGSTPHAVFGTMPVITSATGAEGAQLKEWCVLRPPPQSHLYDYFVSISHEMHQSRYKEVHLVKQKDMYGPCVSI